MTGNSTSIPGPMLRSAATVLGNPEDQLELSVAILVPGQGFVFRAPSNKQRQPTTIYFDFLPGLQLYEV